MEKKMSRKKFWEIMLRWAKIVIHNPIIIYNPKRSPNHLTLSTKLALATTTLISKFAPKRKESISKEQS